MIRYSNFHNLDEDTLKCLLTGILTLINSKARVWLGMVCIPCQVHRKGHLPKFQKTEGTKGYLCRPLAHQSPCLPPGSLTPQVPVTHFRVHAGSFHLPHAELPSPHRLPSLSSFSLNPMLVSPCPISLLRSCSHSQVPSAATLSPLLSLCSGLFQMHLGVLPHRTLGQSRHLFIHTCNSSTQEPESGGHCG